MSYTEVRFVRHAEATHMQTPEIVAGWAPYSVLTEAGIKQAERLGESWAAENYKPDQAYTSPIMRAINTLQIGQMAANMPLEAELDSGLAEQCLGYYEGRPRAEVYTPYVQRMIELQGALYRNQGRNSKGVPGESLFDVSKRMLGFLYARHAENASGSLSVVAMSHSVAIRGLVSYLGLDGHRQPVSPHLLRSHIIDPERFVVPPCSQTLITIEGDATSDLPEVKLAYIGRMSFEDQSP